MKKELNATNKWYALIVLGMFAVVAALGVEGLYVFFTQSGWSLTRGITPLGVLVMVWIYVYHHHQLVDFHQSELCDRFGEFARPQTNLIEIAVILFSAIGILYQVLVYLALTYDKLDIDSARAWVPVLLDAIVCTVLIILIDQALYKKTKG